MSGSTVFSKIDLKETYTQIELGESSRNLTTLIIDKSHYCVKRLIYEINTARDEFQCSLYFEISDLKGVVNISDDISQISDVMVKLRQNMMKT